MTRLEALQALSEKVEARTDTEHDHAAVFPSESAYGHCTWHDSHKAAGGSLDAAKALHEEMLPGWTWEIGPCGADLWPLEKYGDAPHASASIAPKIDPARAWILAILKALIAQEQAKGDE